MVQGKASRSETKLRQLVSGVLFFFMLVVNGYVVRAIAMYPLDGHLPVMLLLGVFNGVVCYIAYLLDDINLVGFLAGGVVAFYADHLPFYPDVKAFLVPTDVRRLDGERMMLFILAGGLAQCAAIYVMSVFWKRNHPSVIMAFDAWLEGKTDRDEQ